MVAEFGFDPVEPGEVAHEPSGDGGAVLEGFFKFAPDVRHAGGVCQVVVPGEC